MSAFTKAELDEIWETKPYGFFSKMAKKMKGKKKYCIRTQAIRITEEVLGEQESIVYAKDVFEAQKLNSDNIAVLRTRFSLASYQSNIRYVTSYPKEVA